MECALLAALSGISSFAVLGGIALLIVFGVYMHRLERKNRISNLRVLKTHKTRLMAFLEENFEILDVDADGKISRCDLDTYMMSAKSDANGRSWCALIYRQVETLGRVVASGYVWSPDPCCGGMSTGAYVDSYA
ncbi:MAG: hypothetical protein K2X27_18435, partial [Candidatus Obscuribacterales bacterium]|nr:hypothetical protein [Candidatus Obscuribacterales bacterium]